MSEILKELRNCSSIEHVERHGATTGFKSRNIPALFKFIRSGSLLDYAERNYNPPEEINAFSVGTAYVHLLSHVPEEKLNIRQIYPLMDGIGNLTFVENIAEIRNEWLAKVNNPVQDLSGVIFISDVDAQFTETYRRLFDLGARMIAVESVHVTNFHCRRNRGGAFFVDSKMVVFAINIGFDPILKQCAEWNNVYTVSFLPKLKGQEVTITMRCAVDLTCITLYLGNRLFPQLLQMQSIVMETEVVVVFGLKNYATDRALMKLARTLMVFRYRVIFFVRRSRTSSVDVRFLLAQEDLWETRLDGYAPYAEWWSRDEIPSDPNWVFTIAPCNKIRIQPDVDPYAEPVAVTFPIESENKESIEIIRNHKMFRSMRLLDFFTECRKIVNPPEYGRKY